MFFSPQVTEGFIPGNSAKMTIEALQGIHQSTEYGFRMEPPKEMLSECIGLSRVAPGAQNAWSQAKLQHAAHWIQAKFIWVRNRDKVLYSSSSPKRLLLLLQSIPEEVYQRPST